MDIGSFVGAVLRRRGVRRALVVTGALAVLSYGLVAIGANGGVIVRGDDGCPRSVGALGSVSWVDVLEVDGVSYQRVDIVAPHVVAQTQVEQQIGAIRCSIGAQVQRPDYDMRDGEATFLEPGTPVHALAGTDIGFGVVAVDDGRPVVYEHRRRDATSGAGLLSTAPARVATRRTLPGGLLVSRDTILAGGR